MRELRNLTREQLANKSKVSIDLLTRIEECTVVGDEFGLGEICRLAKGMGITPYRLMQKTEQLMEDLSAI